MHRLQKTWNDIEGNKKLKKLTPTIKIYCNKAKDTKTNIYINAISVKEIKKQKSYP